MIENKVKLNFNLPQDGKKLPIELYLITTQKCPQRCIYCYNGNQTYHKKNPKDMDTKTALRAVDLMVKNLDYSGRLHILFYGGEPLLNWGLVKDVLVYGSKLMKKYQNIKITYEIFTNLTLMPKDLISYAVKYNLQFVVGIDGIEKIHLKTRPLANGENSYLATAKNIKLLAKNKICFKLRATMTSYNQNHLLETSKLHKELGASDSVFAMLSITDSDVEVIPRNIFPSPKILAEGLKKVYRSKIWDKNTLFPFGWYAQRIAYGFNNNKCIAQGGCKPVVDLDGNIYLCHYFIGNKKFLISNTSDLSYKRDRAIKKAATIKDYIFSDCVKCKFHKICNINICPLRNYYYSKYPKYVKKYYKDLKCNIAKMVIKELLKDPELNKKFIQSQE